MSPRNVFMQKKVSKARMSRLNSPNLIGLPGTPLNDANNRLGILAYNPWIDVYLPKALLVDYIAISPFFDSIEISLDNLVVPVRNLRHSSLRYRLYETMTNPDINTIDRFLHDPGRLTQGRYPLLDSSLIYLKDKDVEVDQSARVFFERYILKDSLKR